jgi:hypothetical protein
MWKNRGADTGMASCSVVDKMTPVKLLESFYHFVHQVIHSFTGEDCIQLILWKNRDC